MTCGFDSIAYAFGRRIQKSGLLGTTNYLYDGRNLLEELDSSGNVLARYNATRREDDQLSEFRSGAPNYYEADGLRSITSLSNSAGNVANTYVYDSFGQITGSTGTTTNPFRYTGREFDQETGSYFYRARYYDQSAGRFLSEDPIRFKAGVNFYAYVNNTPTNYNDPFGLLRDCDQEHIDCVRDCMSKPTGCLPWPVGRSGSPAVRKWSRYAYCTAKCLAEYTECIAANEAQQLAEYCSAHPAICAAYVTAIPIVILQPELAPILF